MPSLNKYALSSEKSGYYVRANVGGSHPVTLQTTTVAEQIFEDNDYSDGSAIPTKLVWSLYDVDLLYTESSLSGSTPSHQTHAALSDTVNDSQLTPSTRNDLVEYFSSYTGSHQQAVTKVLDDLRETISTDAVQTYDVDTPARTAADFLETFTDTDSAEYRDSLRKHGPAIRKSLLSFTQRAPQLDRIEITDRPAVAYHLTPLTLPGDAIVYDRSLASGRGSTGQYDYRIEYHHNQVSSVYVTDQVVQKLNGPAENLSQSDATRLARELTPTPLNRDELSASVEAPPVTDVDVPNKVFAEPDADLLIGLVDRISKSGNPVVELEHSHFLLDTGEENKLYLINRTESQWGRVLCELSHPAT